MDKRIYGRSIWRVGRMKLDIDHTMRFLEKDIPIDLFPLDSPLLKLSLFIVVMSVIVGTTIYRWNLNRE